MYEISLSSEDFLRYQLFTVSRSQTIRKRRTLSRFFIFITFIILAYLFYRDENSSLTVYFIFFAVVAVVFFPRFTSWRYKKHFRKHIDEHYKSKIGVPVKVSFGDDHIISKDSGSEGRIKYDHIDEINEIKENIFIKFKSGDSFIIPKNMTRGQEFIEELRKIADQHQISWNANTLWRWK